MDATTTKFNLIEILNVLRNSPPTENSANSLQYYMYFFIWHALRSIETWPLLAKTSLAHFATSSVFTIRFFFKPNVN